MDKLKLIYYNISSDVKEWIYVNTIISKFKSPLVLAILFAIALFIAIVGANMGVFFGTLLFGAIAGALFLFLCLIYPKIGFFTAFILPFFLFIAERRFGQDLPFGSGIQAMLAATLVIILFKKIAVKDFSFSFLKNNITYAFGALILYNVIQGLNPNLVSLTGWFIVLKGNLALLCTYVVGLYLSQDLKFMKQFLILWVVMALICALYACYQEWFGLATFERNWIHADRLRFNRIFVQGRYRKFSLLSDPTAFGIFMASSTIVTFILATRPMKLRFRLLLMTCAVIMFMAMGYSGTRTAYAMIPVAFIMFGLMTITNRNTLVFAIMGAIAFAFILFGPIHGNATINRIRSTFNSDDASLNIRDVNRQSIQPYIYNHPMGGGVMTTGDAGSKYNPNHDLAGFPPDSGYLKIALETGWIGLLIFMGFLFVGLKEGIKNYYRCRDLTIKFYYLAFITFVFGITIALYAQTVTTQIPISMIFWPIMGMMSNLKSLEKVPREI